MRTAPAAPRGRALAGCLEVNGIKIRPTAEDVARVGLATASGEMGCKELLDWIMENK